MLKDGDKGVILQRDKESYAVIPHMPCGIVTTDQLRKIADVADKHEVALIKLTSAQRMALVGLKEDQIDPIWKDLEMKPGAGVGICVRSVKVCPGTETCKRAQQDSIKLGKFLDNKYHSKQSPAKMKMGVSGCVFDCSETCIKDIGIVGTKYGWRVVVGGNGGNVARLSRTVVDKLSDTEAIEMIDKIMSYFEEYSIGKQRLGAVINKRGWEHFMTEIGQLETLAV